MADVRLPSTFADIPILARALWQAGREERLAAPALRRLQERRFRRLLFTAFDRSPFYARHWSAHGIRREHLATISLSNIPPVDKRLLLEHLEETFTDRSLAAADIRSFLERKDNLASLYRGRECAVHSSGTSGQFGIHLYDRAAWAYVRSLVIRRVSRPRLPFPEKTRLAFFGAVDGHYPGITLLRHAPSFLYSLLLCPVSAPLTDLLPQLEAFRPHQLSGYAWSIWVLARAQLEGRLALRPRAVICSGEPLSAQNRDDIRRAFGVEPVNFYACAESLALGVDRDGNGFRMFDEAHMFEVLRDDHTPALPGEEGRLLLTNLYNLCQPLIRYEMKDRLRLHPLQDGTRLRIEAVGGREVELLWLPTSSGTLDYIHPSALVEFYVPGVRSFQFFGYRDRLVLHAVHDGDHVSIRRIAEEKLGEILRQKQMHERVRVEVERVERLAPDPKTGKFRTINIVESC